MIRRRRRRQPSRPWAPHEDETLMEINKIGLCVDWWHLALPDRGVHEMLDRRLELRLKPAKPI